MVFFKLNTILKLDSASRVQTSDYFTNFKSASQELSFYTSANRSTNHKLHSCESRIQLQCYMQI